jgi:hypothetical protein
MLFEKGTFWGEQSSYLQCSSGSGTWHNQAQKIMPIPQSKKFLDNKFKKKTRAPFQFFHNLRPKKVNVKCFYISPEKF